MDDYGNECRDEVARLRLELAQTQADLQRAERELGAVPVAALHLYFFDTTDRRRAVDAIQAWLVKVRP